MKWRRLKFYEHEAKEPAVTNFQSLRSSDELVSRCVWHAPPFSLGLLRRLIASSGVQCLVVATYVPPSDRPIFSFIINGTVVANSYFHLVWREWRDVSPPCVCLLWWGGIDHVEGREICTKACMNEVQASAQPERRYRWTTWMHALEQAPIQTTPNILCCWSDLRNQFELPLTGLNSLLPCNVRCVVFSINASVSSLWMKKTTSFRLATEFSAGILKQRGASPQNLNPQGSNTSCIAHLGLWIIAFKTMLNNQSWEHVWFCWLVLAASRVASDPSMCTLCARRFPFRIADLEQTTSSKNDEWIIIVLNADYISM